MKSELNDKLNKGLVLPIMEEFFSIQGEGYHTGKAAYFIRIGGCDVGCSWCDVKESWNADLFPPTEVEKVVSLALVSPIRSVVVTGGEPLEYNLNYICNLFKKERFTLFLETSGSAQLSGIWDWICLSPKKNNPPVENIYGKANELKIIVESEDDLRWAEKNAEKVEKHCLLYLQPEWSVREDIKTSIIDYILKNPQWQISMQIHKYLKIP